MPPAFTVILVIGTPTIVPPILSRGTGSAAASHFPFVSCLVDLEFLHGCLGYAGIW